MKIKIIEDRLEFITIEAIRERLEKTLGSIRARYEDAAGGHAENLPRQDTIKIKHRAERFHRRLQRRHDMTRDHVDRLTPLASGIPGIGVDDEHAADMKASDIHLEFGWMGPASIKVWHALRAAARNGDPVRIPPMIISGPPGIGKSTWARQVAKVIGVPAVDIDASKGGVGFEINGTEKGWGTAQPGRPVEALVHHRVANPLVIVDEVCKSSAAESRKGTRLNFNDALLSLLEPTSAQSWTCPFYRVPFDMSHISWIFTANRLDTIPGPLLSRCLVIEIEEPMKQELVAFAVRETLRRNMHEISRDALIEAIYDAPEGLTLRSITRLIDMSIEMSTNRPLFH
jgi:ATP-dependent Lon protease